MEIWDRVKKPPASALKKITGGRLNGKSDISPQWRYQIMTEVFGACGFGWYYTIDKKWLEPVTDGQIVAFADITLYVKEIKDGLPTTDWSMGIPANGGSMLIEKEKAGLHSSDEAYKMAITDALGTAMQRLGVAADIYMGKWDGSKYKDETKKTDDVPSFDDSPSLDKPPDTPQENIVFATLKDIHVKAGTTNGRPWKLFTIVTESGDTYGTFSETVADTASTFIKNGDMAKIEFSVTAKGNKQIVELVA
jgi:hypothetical protein